MQPADIDFLIQLLKKRSGLLLTHDKTYLLESRLLPVARTHGCETLEAFVAKLRTPGAPEALLVEVTEAMTTNETSFYRDKKPFEQFVEQVMPLVRGQATARGKLSIWSAACSMGQEAYTIIMSLLEKPGCIAGMKPQLVATDLDTKVLDKAKKGIYSQFEVQRGLPIQLLVKYFDSLPETSWQIKENIRSMVEFKPLNLLGSFTAMGKFDVIFCRNVLIYFDEPTKAAIIERLCDQLHPKGILFLGSTESILPSNTRLKQLDGLRGIYQLQ